MRWCWIVLLAAAAGGRAEIRDVLKSAEIDKLFSRTSRDLALHEMPNYAVWLKVHSGRPGPYERHEDADDILFIRRGTGVLFLGEPVRRHELGAGDVALIPRRTPHQIDPGAGRLEYVVVRIFPSGENLPPRPGIRPPERKMGEVLTKAEIDATFAKFDRNQPIHAAPNFTMNYVIYSGRGGPWEAHRGCVDIYFLQIGTATAQLGGEIANVKEETPGEIRGAAVSGARSSEIGPGDIVVIPRNTAHHMDPGSGKLGYILIKVWAD